MPIADGKKPWAIVLLHLAGTPAPPVDIANNLRSVFTLGALGGWNLVDFWRGQSRGEIDIAGSTLVDWQPCDWSIMDYPGLGGGVGRDTLADQARKRKPPGDFRGVIAVYNFFCGAGNINRDVVLGLNAWDVVPPWADASERQCKKCDGILLPADAGRPCAAGGTHDASGSTFMTIADTTVPSLRQLARCSRCGLVYDAAEPAGPNECAAMGAHQDSGAKVYGLWRWIDPPAGKNGGNGWSVCRNCRGVLPDWKDDDCPANKKGHDHIEPRVLSFPRLELDYDEVSARSFLAHEMGHAYDFTHGRGIGTRSEDLAGDCAPGGYGDRDDVMSWSNVDATIPDGLGKAGTNLASHHLVGAGLVPPGEVARADENLIVAEGSQIVMLRPAVPAPGVNPPAGAASALRIDDYLVEYRMRQGFDGGIETRPGEPGVVRIHYAPMYGDNTDLRPRSSPKLVPGVDGSPFLGKGDRFEARLGTGRAEIYVEDFPAGGASASVRVSFLPQFAGTRSFKRWLILPCVHDGSAKTIDFGALSKALADCQRFWSDMAAGRFYFGGGQIMTLSQFSDGTDPVPLPWKVADEVAMDARARVKATVDAALSPLPRFGTPGPSVLYQDWRWFTGIVIVREEGEGVGWLGPMTLDAGVMPSHDPKVHVDATIPPCDADDPGTRHSKRQFDFPQLEFDVVELSLDGIDEGTLAATLGRETGRALLPLNTGDIYTLMSPPRQGIMGRFHDFLGPSLDTDELKQLGWLTEGAVAQVEPNEDGSIGSFSAGAVTLQPVWRDDSHRTGVVRAEIGPYALELRVPSGWDASVAAPVVLAFEKDTLAQELHLGDTLTWGSALIEILGGGRITVAELDEQHAVLAYFVQAKAVIEAGGGVLHEGGTVLFGPNGVIHKIQPGDPVESEARVLIERLAQLRKGLNQRGL